MYLTIAVIVGLAVGIPACMYWLLRPRKDIKPGPYHDQLDDAARKTGGGIGGGIP